MPSRNVVMAVQQQAQCNRDGTILLDGGENKRRYMYPRHEQRPCGRVQQEQKRTEQNSMATEVALA